MSYIHKYTQILKELLPSEESPDFPHRIAIFMNRLDDTQFSSPKLLIKGLDIGDRSLHLIVRGKLLIKVLHVL